MHKKSSILAVCLFPVFLLLTPVSPECRTGTAIECKNSDGLVPGLMWPQSGIDITTLGISGKNLMNLHTWLTSGDECTLCENPLLKRKPFQRLPLAITGWKADISCLEEVQHSILKSPISVAEEMTELTVKNDWKKELDVEVKSGNNDQWILTGSQHGFISFMKWKSSEENFIFLLHHVSCSYYKFGINKDKAVSQAFKNHVKLLPEKYDGSSKLKYHDLIKSYGTHFITQVDMGAHVMFLTALPVCLIALEGFTVSQVSHCLEIEVGKIIGFDKVTKNPNFQKCKEILANLSYHGLSSHQLRYVLGGDSHLSSAFQLSGFTEDPEEWLESVRSDPYLLSYSLEPLHNLVDNSDPRREGVRQAVSEYMRDRALWWNCTHSCPPGAQQSASVPCFCECPKTDFTNSMCCPKQRGLAKLTLTIQHAEGLWGDYFTRTDGYVNVLFQDKLLCTSTVWNDNNPVWNATLDFGIVDIGATTKLKVEVWDEDFGWNDDLLGRCILDLESWDSTRHVCWLNHGTLHYKYHLVCHPHLGGPDCLDYMPLWIHEILSRDKAKADTVKQNIP